jgi:hypothetical protein
MAARLTISTHSWHFPADTVCSSGLPRPELGSQANVSQLVFSQALQIFVGDTAVRHPPCEQERKDRVPIVEFAIDFLSASSQIVFQSPQVSWSLDSFRPLLYFLRDRIKLTVECCVEDFASDALFRRRSLYFLHVGGTILG